jgi:16S rRNA A1518/A1519 N6-dimethyltransferase RsmA/KsgA/DIM1 with predicted DNA glycosylase/AP lyase activity
LTRRARPQSPLADEPAFRDFLRGLFQSRRKTLANALRGSGYAPDIIAETLRRCGVDGRTRPEQLDLGRFVCLYSALHPGSA